MVRTVDRATLIPDESKTIDEGAVAPWNSLMWSLMTDVCREMGVRTNVPFKDLTEKEKEIVYDGPMEKKHIFYVPKNKNSAAVGELDMTYYSATATVLNALNKVKDEKGMKRVEKFLKEDVCPDCHGTRLSEEARAPKLMEISLAGACRMTLKESIAWVKRVPESLPEEMRNMAETICESYLEVAARLMDLGLGYLTLGEETPSLSGGEAQRLKLASEIGRTQTDSVFVFDEPSIGLHPLDVQVLLGVFQALLDNGATVVVIEYDLDVIRNADYIIDMGPGGGDAGGRIVACGTPEQICNDPASITGRYLRR